MKKIINFKKKKDLLKDYKSIYSFRMRSHYDLGIDLKCGNLADNNIKRVLIRNILAYKDYAESNIGISKFVNYYNSIPNNKKIDDKTIMWVKSALCGYAGLDFGYKLPKEEGIFIANQILQQ